MTKFKYFADLKKEKVKVRSKKVNGILDLIKIRVPTVPDPWMLRPGVYHYYLKNKKLPLGFIEELKAFLANKKKQGKTLTYRPSIFSPAEKALDLYVKNTVNILDFNDVKKTITKSFNDIIKASKHPKKVEFSALMQTFYDSDRCGVLQTSDNKGHIYIEAIFGQHSGLLTREGAEYDTYQIDKETMKIIEKNIAQKTKTLVKSKKGLRYKKLSQEKSEEAVLSQDYIKKLADYSFKLEKRYGNQEVEWAVLVSGELIVQDTRDLHLKKHLIDAKIKTIYPGDIEGRVLVAKSHGDLAKLSGKILVTDNMDVSFIMKAVTEQKPLGVLLTKGSIMSHAATVLRELKIPSFLIENLKVKNEDRIKLERGMIKET